MDPQRGASSRRPGRAVVVGMLVATMASWSLCYPLIRLGLAYAPPFHFAALRALLAGAALCLLGLAARRPLPRRAAAWAWLSLAGLGATTTGFYGMFFAGELVAPGVATIVANTQPLIAAILAFLVLRERLEKVQWLGLLLGFAGILAIAGPTLRSGGSPSALAGYAYVLVAALGVAVGNLAIKRVADRVDAFVAMGAQLLIGALPLVGLARMLERPSEALWSLPFLAVLASVGLVGTSLAFVLWCTALRHIELSRANTFSFLTPLFAVFIGYVGYGERLGWNDAAGAGAILAGLWCVSRASRDASAGASPRRGTTCRSARSSP